MTTAKTPEPMTGERDTPRPGLRIAIAALLVAIMCVAFVPLFFAVAQVARATSLSYREDAARALARSVQIHVAATPDAAALDDVLALHVARGPVLEAALFDDAGVAKARAARPGEAVVLRAPARPYAESWTRASSASGRALDVVLPLGGDALVVRVQTDEDKARTAGILRAIALYMGLFALALLVFTGIAMGRVVVRPIEQLARSADKVASGARALEVPRGGAREIADLASSVRAMAAKLLAEEEALRAKVAELTATTKRLGETREQLAGSERLASVGRLAAGVAHEIGNPIAAIMGMQDLLTTGDLEETDRQDFLRRMRKETERIHVVVRDLLDYARPEEPPASGAAASCRVLDVVEDALGLARPQKGFREVHVHVDVDADARVGLSEQRLTQVLLNLLLNAGAALASKSGSRNVWVRTRPPSDGVVRLEVEDDGPGVPESLGARIFDPFVTTKDVGEGTGLGLSVCRGIVEGAGGTLRHERGAEGGARFVVELPRLRAPS